jgi:hypothetical protein
MSQQILVNFGQHGENRVSYESNQTIGRSQAENKNRGNITVQGTVFSQNNKTTEETRKQIKEQAMKIIQSTLDGEVKVDTGLREASKRARELMKEVAKDTELLKHMQEQRKQMQEEYQVAEDSQEMADTKLLLASKSSMSMLSEEQMERISELEKQGYTDYQKYCLAQSDECEVISGRIHGNKRETQQLYATIRAVRIERLKSSPMVTANQVAKEIEKKAEEQLSDSLYEEAVTYLEEEAEEAQEKEEITQENLQKKQEFVQETKEKIEEAKELTDEWSSKADTNSSSKRTGNKDVLDEIWDSLNQLKEATSNQKEIVDKQKSVNTEIMGMIVDELR